MFWLLRFFFVNSGSSPANVHPFLVVATDGVWDYLKVPDVRALDHCCIVFVGALFIS